MTKLFFDHLIVLEEVETEIKKTASSKEEKEELWGLVDEIITHKVLKTVMDKLPKESHVEFLELFHKCPHDEEIIFGYLRKNVNKDIEKELQQELKNISSDILRELKPQDEILRETSGSKK